MSRDFTPKEINELMLLSADDALVAINKRMNEPEVIVEPEIIPVPINYRAMVYPKVETQYWYIESCKIKDCFWLNDDVDQDRFQHGNYFTSWSKAELESDWRIWNTRILNSIAILNKEYNWVVDWNDGQQGKWYFYWNKLNGKITGNYSYSLPHQENNKYFCGSTQEKLLELYTEEELKFWITKERGE